MLEVGDVDLVAAGVNAVHQPGVVLGRGGGKVPVDEVEIGLVAEEIPAHEAAGIDEMDLDVGRAGDLVEVEARLGKSA